MWRQKKCSITTNVERRYVQFVQRRKLGQDHFHQLLWKHTSMQNLIVMIPTILVEYVMDVICYLIIREMGMMSNYQLIKHISREKKCLLRSDGLICHCIICTVARSFGAEVANSKKKRGRPKSESETTPKPATIKVCLCCYQNINAGCRHQC